jgi:hypothetical protein
MSSYVVKSKGRTLQQIADSGDWGFLRWAAANMSIPAAREEAIRLVATAPAPRPYNTAARMLRPARRNLEDNGYNDIESAAYHERPY